MKTLVTGATGLVGYSIARRLLARGREVRVVARTPEKAKRLLPEADIVRGDVTDRASMVSALDGCDVVYHAAGRPEQWLADADGFETVNVGGTRNVVEAALEKKVRRLVYTSTIDVFAAESGASYDESVIDPEPKGTLYERSKQDADRVVVAALERGLDAVFLHPSAVYGPGPAGSPGINDMVEKMLKKKLPAVPPGGLPVVFAEDVGEGHVRAEERAQAGARYILSERYVPMAELARIVSREIGMRAPPSLPLVVAKAVSHATEALARLTGLPPLAPKGQLHFLQWGARPVSTKARRELDIDFVPFAEGIARLVAALRAQSAAAK
jgi:dihydroflavonol-4-reductase